MGTLMILRVQVRDRAQNVFVYYDTPSLDEALYLARQWLTGSASFTIEIVRVVGEDPDGEEGAS